MEKFRELIADMVFSREISNYEDKIEEGRKKRDSCIYFMNGVCSRYVIKKDSILLEWIGKDRRATPHPLLCYICPYYSLKAEERKDILDIIELYVYYENEKELVERELLFLDRRYEENPFHLSLKRRREDLIIFLENINEKINIIKRIIKVEGVEDKRTVEDIKEESTI